MAVEQKRKASQSAVISLLQKYQKSCDYFFLMLLLQHTCVWKITCQIFNLCWITTLGLYSYTNNIAAHLGWMTTRRHAKSAFIKRLHTYDFIVHIKKTVGFRCLKQMTATQDEHV